MESEKEPPGLGTMPLEILQKIFGNLEIEDHLLGVANTSRWLRAAVDPRRHTQHEALDALSRACRSNNLVAAKYFNREFGLREFVIGNYNRRMIELFAVMCIKKYSDIARWMSDTFSLPVVATVGGAHRTRLLEIFGTVCGKGDIDLAQWLHTTFSISGDECRNQPGLMLRNVFETNLAMVKWLIGQQCLAPNQIETGRHIACENNKVDIGKWLIEKYPPLFPAELLLASCTGGSTELVEYIVYKFPSKCDSRLPEAMLYACRAGHMPVARQLMTKFRSTMYQCYDRYKDSLLAACSAGHLHIARHLSNTIFRGKMKDMPYRPADINDCVVHVVAIGRLDILKWMHANLDIKKEYLYNKHHICEALLVTFDYAIIKWLVKTYGFTREDQTDIIARPARERNWELIGQLKGLLSLEANDTIRAFALFALNDDVASIQRLMEIFSLSDPQPNVSDLLRRALITLSTDVVVWILTKYPAVKTPENIAAIRAAYRFVFVPTRMDELLS